MATRSSTPNFRFLTFELDTQRRVLTRGGRRVKLNPQPLTLLTLLASRSGELVSRETIRHALWPDGDHVDFDQGINQCVRELRRVLGDRRDRPRFIETVPKRGYRFIAPVEPMATAVGASVPEAAADYAAGGTHRATVRPHIGWFVVAVLLAAMGAYWGVVRVGSGEASIDAFRFSVLPPDGAHLSGDTYNWPQLSPDGRFLTFNIERGGKRLLAVNEIGTLRSRVLDATESAHAPLWAPDGEQIGFLAHRSLRVVDINSGHAREIQRVETFPRGGSWNEEGVILVSVDHVLRRTTPTGQAWEDVTRLDPAKEELFHAWPSFLPDGTHFIYLAVSASEEHTGLYVGSLEGGATPFLLPTRSPGRYVSSGHLMFVREGTLFAQPFDPERLELWGHPQPVVENVRRNELQGGASFSLSRGGTLAFLEAGDGVSVKQLTWFDRAGRRIAMVGRPGPFLQLAMSSDARYAAVVRRNRDNGTDDIDLLDLENDGSEVRFADSPLIETGPVWSPDGRELAYTIMDGRSSKVVVGVVGESETRTLLTSDIPRVVEQWSNGHGIVLLGMNGIERIPPGGGSLEGLVSGETSDQDGPRLSPNGRLLAYIDNVTGQFEVYVKTVGGGAEPIRVSADGGGQPRWVRDGQELVFVANDGFMMSADVADAGELRVSKPRPLFKPELIFNPLIDQYAITQDGERFLVLCPVPGQASLNVVLNWTDSLSN